MLLGGNKAVINRVKTSQNLQLFRNLTATSIKINLNGFV